MNTFRVHRQRKLATAMGLRNTPSREKGGIQC